MSELGDETARFRRGWLSRSQYTGRWPEAVQRFAVALKLVTYAPSGALAAAPTGGLAEQIGGERHWDYRYAWIRDALFSVYALLAGAGRLDQARLIFEKVLAYASHRGLYSEEIGSTGEQLGNSRRLSPISR